MKKFTILLFAAIMIAGTVFAQPVRDQQREANPQADRQREVNPQRNNRHDGIPQTEIERRRDLNNERFREAAPITINGILKLERGIVAIQSDGETYLIPMLNRFIGFIGGLREGANISVEGYKIRNIINPTNVIIDGQSYDFKRLAQNNVNLNNDRRELPRHNRDNFRHNRNNHSHKDKHNNYNRR